MCADGNLIAGLGIMACAVFLFLCINQVFQLWQFYTFGNVLYTDGVIGHRGYVEGSVGHAN